MPRPILWRANRSAGGRGPFRAHSPVPDNPTSVTGISPTAASVITSPWTPGPNELVLVSVAMRATGITPTVAGNGLTFVSVQDVVNAQAQSRLVVFRAMGASPSSGAITVTATANTNPIGVIATRFANVDTSGTDGSGAVEASVQAAGPPVTDDVDMLAAVTTVTANALAWGAGTYRSGLFTVPSGQSAILTNLLPGGAGGAEANSSQWYVGPVVTPASTTVGAAADLNTVRDWAMVAISIKPAGAGGSVTASWSDAVTQSDVWTRLGTFLRDETEAVTQTDAWTRTGTFLRSWSESVAQSDAWSGIKVLARTLTEAVTSSDVWTRTGTFGRSLTESVTQVDVWTRSVGFVRSFTSAVTSADAWTRTGTFLRSLTEAVSHGDVWTGIKVVLRTWSESVTQTDSWTRSATFIRTTSDAVVHSDAWTRSGTFLRALAGSVSQADTWVGTKLGAILASWSESVTSSDAWSRVGTYKRSFTSGVTQLDGWVGSTVVTVIGGLAPIGSAIASFVGGIAHAFRPEPTGNTPKPDARANTSTPDGRADDDKPSGSASNPRT